MRRRRIFEEEILDLVPHWTMDTLPTNASRADDIVTKPTAILKGGFIKNLSLT